MKIVHLVPKFKPSIGGVENFLNDLIEIQSRVHEVKITTSNVFSFSPFIKMKARNEACVYRYDAINLFPFLPRGLGIVPIKLISDLLEEETNIIHSHAYGYFTTYFGSFMKLTRKTKHVVQTHSDPGRSTISKKIFDAIVPKFSLHADKIIAISKIEKEHLVKLGLDENKIAIIPLGINIEKFKRFRIEGVSEDFILFVGRFDIEQKGIDILLKAFKIISKRFSKIKLLLAGSGDEHRIKKLAIELGILDKISIEKNVSEERLIKLYKLCKFLVLPSRFEPFGLVILEAFACGKTVIASKVGGIPEIINPSNGILVPPEDHESLANAISYLLENEDKLYELSKNAEEHSFEFDIRKTAKKIDEVYEEVYK